MSRLFQGSSLLASLFRQPSGRQAGQVTLRENIPDFDVLEPSIKVKVGPWGLEKLGAQMRILMEIEFDFQWGKLSFVLGSLSRDSLPQRHSL